MSVLRQPRISAVRNLLDLNGPLVGPFLYLFEAVRAYFYVATTASLIYEILNSLALSPDAFAFVDMGSGKGRALLIASEFAFAKIVGVDLSANLHRIAQENIKLYSPASQPCTNFELNCMNVVDYKYGPEPVVLFLFDPF